MFLASLGRAGAGAAAVDIGPVCFTMGMRRRRMFLISFALAAPSLVLDEPAWLPDATSVWDGDGVEVAMPRGFLFRVLADDQPAGVVFVGDGDARADVPEMADRLRLASVLVGLERPEGALASVLDEGAWDLSVDRVLLVDAEAPALLDGLEQVVTQGKAVGYEDGDGVFQVVVTGVKLDAARRAARNALHERAEALAELHLDPGAAARLERLEAAGRSVLDLHTADSFAAAVPGGRPGPRTHWLTWVVDPTGLVHDSYAAQLLASALAGDPEGAVATRLTGRRHAADPVAVQFDKAVSNVVFTPDGGQGVELTVDTRLTVHADRATALLPLWLPNPRPPERHGAATVADRFEVRAVVHDGLAATPLDLAFGAMAEPGWTGGIYQLAEPLVPGEPSVITVKTRDQLALDQRRDTTKLLEDLVVDRGGRRCFQTGPYICARGEVKCECDGDDARPPPTVRLGVVTEPQRVLPRRPGQTRPYPAELRVGVADRALEVVVSGGEPLAREADRWWRSVTRDNAVVAVGDWKVHEALRRTSQPAMSLYVRGPDTGADGFVRSVLHFFDPALPEPPWQRLAVVLGPSQVSLPFRDVASVARPTAEGLPGLVHVRPVEEIGLGIRGGSSGTLRSEFPHGLQRDMAHAVAAQWWHGHAVGRADRWIVAAMPRVYRDLYLRHATDDDVLGRWAVRRAEVLATLPAGPWTLDQAAHDDARLEQLAWWFTGLVRARTGEQALLRALDQLLQSGEPLTTAALRASLEETSGRDLSDVFDYWLAGLQPDVDVTLHDEGAQTRVEVATDLPFGRFQLPLQAKGRWHWVDVVDGRGEGVVDARSKAIEVDPEGWLPIR